MGLGAAPLLERLESVARHGTKAEKYAYLLAGRKRLAEILRRDGSAGVARGPGAATNRYQLGRVLDALENKITSEERERRRGQEGEKLEMLRGINQLCFLGKNDANTHYEIHSRNHNRPPQNPEGRPAFGGGGRIAESHPRRTPATPESA